MYLRRSLAALMASFTLIVGAPAAAQGSRSELAGPLDPSPAAPGLHSRGPEFRMPEGDFRRVGERRNGLIAAIPLNPNLDIGIGRFRVGEIARPRTHMETERQPTSVRSRDRSIAGIGFSLRFGN